MPVSPYWLRWGASIELATRPNIWLQGSRLKDGQGSQILFGRVQEDTSLEASLAYGRRALCIASGGETAFDLLLGGARDVVSIDINPAQAILVHFKSSLFRHLPGPEINDAFTKDARPAYQKIKGKLPKEVTQYVDSHLSDYAHGLVHCGKIDRDLRKAMGLFHSFVHPRRRIEALIEQPSLDEQALSGHLQVSAASHPSPSYGVATRKFKMVASSFGLMILIFRTES